MGFPKTCIYSWVHSISVTDTGDTWYRIPDTSLVLLVLATRAAFIISAISKSIQSNPIASTAVCLGFVRRDNDALTHWYRIDKEAGRQLAGDDE